MFLVVLQYRGKCSAGTIYGITVAGFNVTPPQADQIDIICINAIIYINDINTISINGHYLHNQLNRYKGSSGSKKLTVVLYGYLHTYGGNNFLVFLPFVSIFATYIR